MIEWKQSILSYEYVKSLLIKLQMCQNTIAASN